MIDNIRRKIFYQMLLERRGGNLLTPFSMSTIIASVTSLCPNHQLSGKHKVTSVSGCFAVKFHPADRAMLFAWRRFQCQPCIGMKQQNPSAIKHRSSRLLLWNIYEFWINLTGLERNSGCSILGLWGNEYWWEKYGFFKPPHQCFCN